MTALVLAVFNVVVVDGFGRLLHLDVHRAETIAYADADIVGSVVAPGFRMSRIAGVDGRGDLGARGVAEGVGDSDSHAEPLLFQEGFLEVDAVEYVVCKGGGILRIERHSRFPSVAVGGHVEVPGKFLPESGEEIEVPSQRLKG